jgi:hypothetical protein
VEYVSPTNVKANVNTSNGGKITYKITVENTSDVTYWYRGVSAPVLDGYKNELVGKNGGINITTQDKENGAAGSFGTDDWVPPHTTRDFYATYNFGSGATGNVKTFVNFEFGGKIASYGDGILAILNDPVKYAALSGALNDIYKENNTDTISNVGADAAFIQSLFDTELELDGKPVTITIQRRDVDDRTTGDAYPNGGPSGCEYTIYVTTDDPTTGTPVVQAVSYTKGNDGEWYQIGELYKGTVNIGTYKDSEGNSHASINVNSWQALPESYRLYSYNGGVIEYQVGQKNGDQYQIMKTIDDIMSTKDQNFYNAIDNANMFKTVYDILQKHKGDDSPEVVGLRTAFENASPYYVNHNNGQEFKVKRTLRSELISTIESIAKALEYYTQIRG